MAGEKNSKYKPEYDELAYNYALLGATDKQLGEFFDVSEVTINAWKKDHPSFLKSLKKGKSIADSQVANALFHRALGYSHPETKIATNEGRITDSQEFMKHYAPDPTAAIFWLKNRQPALWRDKTEQVVTLNDDFDSLLDDAVSDDEE
jgi:DNA-binding XRE family transcriptional regulator